MSASGTLAACSVLLAAYAFHELAAEARVAAGVQQLWAPLARLRSAGGTGILDRRGRLARAGLSGRLSPTFLLACRAAGVVVAMPAALIAAPAAPGRLSWLILIGLPGAGFIAPDALLERAARLRRERLVAALPDALDLLSVSAATGRSTASAFAELAGAGDGPLATELAITVAEISTGVPQQQALAALRERVSGAELAALAAAIERSRRFGSPLADQLRRQASGLRIEKRRRVQERAARAAPKIQLVVALVLVPSVLLMIAAALIAYSDALLGGF